MCIRDSLGGIQKIVHHLCLGNVPLFHLLQTADALKVLEDLAAAVNRPAVGKVLLKELQSLGLDVRVLRDNGEEVDMSENIDYSDTNYDLRSIIEGDRRYNDKEDLSDYGFQKQEFKGDELVNVEEDDYTNDGAKDDYVDDDYTEDDDK